MHYLQRQKDPTGTSRELNHVQSMCNANSVSYRFEVFMFCRESLPVVPFTFQISTSVHLILVKMAPHVLILLQVIAVIVKKDILETTVKQVRTTPQDDSCSLYRDVSFKCSHFTCA